MHEYLSPDRNNQIIWKIPGIKISDSLTDWVERGSSVACPYYLDLLTNVITAL